MNKFRYLLGTAVVMMAGLSHSAQAQQRLFPDVDTNFTAPAITIPGAPYKYTVLFREGESIVKTADGKQGLAKGNHDFMTYLPINGSNEHGRLIVNHELRDSNSTFGDGGGMTVFEVRRQNGEWGVVGDYRNVDFSTVGGTFVNCGGARTPFGHVLTAEEFPPNSNATLYSNGRQYRDTSDVTIEFNGAQRTIRRYQNMGWLVEVDPENARAVRKLWKMGRFSHEGAWCMNDGKTVYLTDDNTPGVFFKFVATTVNDYEDGQLYAYKQSADGTGGEWLTMPMEFDSLMIARDVALRMGATIFNRLEWPVEHGGKLYITETGADNFDVTGAVSQGGVISKHMESKRVEGEKYDDPYGRVLEFDIAANRMRSFVEGGRGASQPWKHLSNPDGLTIVQVGSETYLAMNEDIIGEDRGRTSPDADAAGRAINEVYWLNLSTEEPTVDNLKLFLVGPAGCETTGGAATPDGSTYFVNIQHPSGANPPPFNKSATIAVTGFGAYSAEDDFGVFPPIDTNFAAQTVHIPEDPYKYTVLFREGESIVKTADGKQGLAKGNHDFMTYLPINGSNEHGRLIVNHELRDSNSTFGDGGGMTVFEVRRQNGEWGVVGDYRNVDFSTVGGTFVNCGGARTPFGHVLTAEEFPPNSNATLYSNGRQYRDTSDVTIEFNGAQRTIRRYQNMGWLVEVDPENARAVRKLWKMGRFSHEGAWCMNDGKTVYLTDDNTPGVFFKFVATTVNDYEDGQLYAYKQSADGTGGEWLTMPMEFDSLMIARDVALRMGATIFNRLEWPVEHGGKLYVTETGADNFDVTGAVSQGGVISKHMESKRVEGEKYDDPYGRVLEFDIAANRMRSFIEGGRGTWVPTNHLSNPDGLTIINLDGKTYLGMNEDIIGEDRGRTSPDADAAGRAINEVYWVDLSIANPGVDDLKLFLVGPAGCETTGGAVTPDANTYFVNIQHPSGANPPPFNKSATIAVTGFDQISSVVDPVPARTGFRLYPNPALQTVYFNRTTDVALYDARGERIRVEENVNSLDVSNLVPGVYYVQTINGETAKVIVE